MSQSPDHPAVASSYRHFIALILTVSEADDTFRMEAARVDDGALSDIQSTTRPDKAGTMLSSIQDDRPVIVYGIHHLDDHEAWLDLSAALSPEIRLIDVQQLARILLPRLRDHALQTVSMCVRVPSADTTETEAGCLAQTFLALLDLLFTRELDVVRNLARLTQAAGDSLYDLFIEAEAYLIKHAFARGDKPAFQEDLLIPSCNVTGIGAIGNDEWEYEEADYITLDEDRIAGIFDRGGVFAKKMEKYEHRPQQIDMVRSVTQAFNEGKVLIAEAGTGTGKSLSYLAPAIHWALQNDQRVIISTNTKNLQEQLFFKDVPFIREALQLEFRAALLKGRSNYICPDRWQAVLSQPDDHLSHQERAEALPLVVWMEETATGDVSENTGFHLASNRNLWQKINAEGGSCARCALNDACFVTRARSAAALSHLVIINHALLFSDLAADNAVLSDYTHLIVDEAHNLEKVAVQHMTVEINIWRFRALLRKLYNREGIETGLLATLKWRAERSPMKQAWKDQLAAAVRQGVERVNAASGAADEFFDMVYSETLDVARDNGSGYTVKYRFKMDTDFSRFLTDQAAPLLQSLLQLRDVLGRLGATIDEIPASWLADRDEFLNTIAASLDTCKKIEEDLGVILQADDENAVYWVEAAQRGSTPVCVLIAAPLNVADRLYESLFSRMRTVVLTSATLTVGKKFSYIAGRLGLQNIDAVRASTFQADSPFDYQDQAIVCVPSNFPSPRMDTFQKEVSDLVQGLVCATRRSTLVLFTAYGMLNRTYADLERPLRNLGTPLLAQGISGPRSLILDQFRDMPGSVLLGTDSFWEGIDVPGEALEIVVLVKLPFAVPSEPIVQAQTELLDKAGRNSFLEYLAPEAVIKFRQGFGRLIRSEKDRGAVVILDQRVIGTRYGGLFLESLPARHRVFKDADALVEGVTRWFDHRRSKTG